MQSRSQRATDPAAVRRVPSSELDVALDHPFLHEDLGPVLVVDIDVASWAPSASASESLHALPSVTIGVLSENPTATEPFECFDLLLAPPARSDSPAVISGDADALLIELLNSIDASPDASVVLAQLLRMTANATVRDALIAESLAYATLQSGPTFQRWLAESDYSTQTDWTLQTGQHPRTEAETESAPDALLVEAEGDEWTLSFNRPERHNAFSAEMRDLLVEALRTALAAGASAIRLRGEGPSFSSGGDLREFGTTPDATTGHLVRSTRSAPWWVHVARTQLTVELHGTCFGAGIELAAFADRVVAHPDTTICLPEVRFGLVPGAGGTASIPRRIGRHRTLWLALTGTALDAPTSLAWGLVDELSAK